MRYERSFNILYPCRVYMRPTETSLVLISVEIDEREFNLIIEIIIIISVNVDKLAQEFVIKKKKSWSNLFTVDPRDEDLLIY